MDNRTTKYAKIQRSSRTQDMHQKTEWLYVYFENIVNETLRLEKSVSSLIGRVIQLPISATFPLAVVKCFQHGLPTVRKFQHDSTVKLFLIFTKFNFPMGYACTYYTTQNLLRIATI